MEAKHKSRLASPSLTFSSFALQRYCGGRRGMVLVVVLEVVMMVMVVAAAST